MVCSGAGGVSLMLCDGVWTDGLCQFHPHEHQDPGRPDVVAHLSSRGRNFLGILHVKQFPNIITPNSQTVLKAECCS